jgi:hypothetical protein
MSVYHGGDAEVVAGVANWLDARTKGLISVVSLIIAAVACAFLSLSESGSLLPLLPVAVLAGVFVLGAWLVRRRLERLPGPASAAPETQPPDPWAAYQARQAALSDARDDDVTH